MNRPLISFFSYDRFPNSLFCPFPIKRKELKCASAPAENIPKGEGEGGGFVQSSTKSKTKLASHASRSRLFWFVCALAYRLYRSFPTGTDGAAPHLSGGNWNGAVHTSEICWGELRALARPSLPSGSPSGAALIGSLREGITGAAAAVANQPEEGEISCPKTFPRSIYYYHKAYRC